MPNTAKKSETLEILISTMHKDSLTFLEQMFPDGKYQEYAILIVNQTTKEKQLKSHFSNIRVINSFDTGLPQSRNLALKNAIGDICLIADDDVKYHAGFSETILNAFKANLDADIITFKMVDEKGNDFKKYTDIKHHDKKTIKTVNSVVIGLRPKSILDNAVTFNNNFGLGTTFQTANEYVFLRNALKKNLTILFEPKIILSHDYFSSGRYAGNDKLVYGRAAVFYKYSGILGYLRLIKYVYFIYKRGFITANQILPKLATGFKGISKYKALVKKGLEIR